LPEATEWFNTIYAEINYAAVRVCKMLHEKECPTTPAQLVQGGLDIMKRTTHPHYRENSYRKPRFEEYAKAYISFRSGWARGKRLSHEATIAEIDALGKF
jgi:hypothetical protein